MSYAYGFTHLPPPDPPELPEGADPRPRWPAWYAPLGFVSAFAVTVILFMIAGAFAAAFGTDISSDSSALTVIGTVIQNIVLIGTAVFLASRTSRPRPWHFGLRKSRFWPTVGWSALGLVSFYVFAATYSAILNPSGEQTVAEDLGADKGTFALIVAGVLVIVIAPIAEEFFFRGFFYRALRTRFRIPTAALIGGLVFGAIHFTGSDTLSILPILGVLGVVFCLVYERTGTLFAPIALHAVNNTVAFSVATDGSVAISLILGPLMVAGCVLIPRYTAAMRAAPAHA
jgi:membrane protease YdiL (CAAX protease family)